MEHLVQYLQEATEKHERDNNYYDGWHVATNTSSWQQEANFLEQDDNAGSDEKDNKASVSESNGKDTGTHYGSPPGHNIQPQDELETIPEEEEPQTEEKQYIVDQDTVVSTSDESEEEPFNTAIDNTGEDPELRNTLKNASYRGGRAAKCFKYSPTEGDGGAWAIRSSPG